MVFFSTCLSDISGHHLYSGKSSQVQLIFKQTLTSILYPLLTYTFSYSTAMQHGYLRSKSQIKQVLYHDTISISEIQKKSKFEKNIWALLNEYVCMIHKAYIFYIHKKCKAKQQIFFSEVNNSLPVLSRSTAKHFIMPIIKSYIS